MGSYRAGKSKPHSTVRVDFANVIAIERASATALSSLLLLLLLFQGKENPEDLSCGHCLPVMVVVFALKLDPDPRSECGYTVYICSTNCDMYWNRHTEAAFVKKVLAFMFHVHNDIYVT